MAGNQYDMQNPLTQYPPLEIPEQKQSEPGLDARLKPKADHGEDTYKGLGRLNGRRALITGADSGIGRAVAIAFAREGADIVLSYLPEEQTDADTTIKHIEDAGRKAVPFPADISDEKACIKLVQTAIDACEQIDILVNNAGRQVYVESVEDISTEQLQNTFATNVFAMYWITKALLPHMPAGSSIINTTSIQSYQPSSGLLDYASTKGAITTYTKGLAKMVADRGIRVNAVAPGPIWTPLQPSFGQPMEKLKQFGKSTPLGRPGQPAEVAPIYVFLASQESSYITAEVIGVTGGKHLP